MSPRSIALASAFGIVAIVFAQDVAPQWRGFHDWPYALLVALLCQIVFGYANDARRGRDGEVGARLVFAMIGAFVIGGAGLASALLGPDTETIVRAPGTVAPLPEVGAAAFFPSANAADIARGDAAIVLRRRSGAGVELLPGKRRFFGATELQIQPQTAAYVEARDVQGRRVTITQPTNPSFLSPVLLFGRTVPIAGKDLPSDAFATPALHRQIKAFYFSKAEAAHAAARLPAKDVVLFAVDDGSGKLLQGAIGFAPSGAEVTLGGVRLRPTIGSYPALVVSAVPYPAAAWLGLACFVGGAAYAFAGKSA